MSAPIPFQAPGDLTPSEVSAYYAARVPQLPQRGRVDSFNGRLREECLNVSWFQNRFDARRKIAAWRREYNEERPHSSLDYRTPQEFAALVRKNQEDLCIAGVGQEASIASPLPETPSGWRFAPIPAHPGDGVEFPIPK